MLYDLAVIGGGAAGMAAAVTASRAGDSVVILEAGDAPGKKISASGNGRCNLMNSGKPRYYGESGFAKEVISRCGQDEQVRFWRSVGLMTAEESENRVYPCTFQSSTVMDVLKTALQINDVKLVLKSPVTACVKGTDNLFRLTAGNETYHSRRVLVSTGGPAGRKVDGVLSGYSILEDFGHRIHPLRPALVPLVTDRRSISGLSGVRVRCGIKLADSAGTTVHQEKGEILFTEYGVSGICAMQCGRFVEHGGYILELDFADRLFENDNSLMKELLFRKTYFSNMAPEMLLAGMLNLKLSYAVMKQSGIALKGEKLKDLDERILEDVVKALRHYRITVLGTRGMSEAQVTSGGAECDEFSPENMESRIIPGLHAAGEILNTDGDCGGFNLMFAFGSGILAGLNKRNA